jgi:hypothetical protein
MGFEPMNTGFADQRVSHFAIGAHARRTLSMIPRVQQGTRFLTMQPAYYFGCAVVRR